MSKTPKLRFKEFSGDWGIYLLGKSITLYDNERKPVKEQERNSGEYAYYGATGIIDYIDDYIFEGEYLLLGEDGANIVTRNAPLIYKTHGKFWVNNHAHIFKPKEGFNIDYMKQRLELINYIPYNTGTAQPKLNADSIKSIPFKAPTLEEQEKIASLFSLIDEKIYLQDEKLKMLKDYKKGMMQKIFSRELRFKDDEGRDYPEWEEKKLRDILTPRIEKQVPSQEAPLMAFTSTGGIEPKGDKYDRSFLVKSDGKLYKRTELNDFIYSSNNLDVGSIGLNKYGTAVISDVYEVFIISKEVSCNFISELIQIPKVLNKVIRYRQGVMYGQYRIHADEFLKIREFIPCLEEQCKIDKFIGNIDLKIKKEQEKLGYLNEYKKGLLQQMFV